MNNVLYDNPRSFQYLQIVEKTKDHKGVWISRDAWFNPLEIRTGEEDFLPAVLKDLIIKWRNDSSNVEDDFPYIKHAKERFVYKDNYYELYPSSLNLTEVQMDRFFTKMELDLYNLGCLYMVYDGMLD